MIDSQSVKTSFQGGVRGFDGGKKVNGRKRYILTDTMGLVLAVLVHCARQSDGAQAPWLLRRLHRSGPIRRLERIYADQSYRGTPGGLVWRCFGWIWQIVERDPEAKGFVVLKKRWIVERTFSWLEGYRRLDKDHERLRASSEAMVQLAMTRLMLGRSR